MRTSACLALAASQRLDWLPHQRCSPVPRLSTRLIEPIETVPDRAEVRMLGHPGAVAGSDLKPRQGKIPVADLVRLDVESRGDERYDDICR